MKSKKIRKKITLNKQTIATLNVNEMNHQRGGTDTCLVPCTTTIDPECSPTIPPRDCSAAETFCITVCIPRSACDWSCPLSC
jgi:natural product precursor